MEPSPQLSPTHPLLQFDAEAAASGEALDRAARPGAHHGQQPSGEAGEELRRGGQGQTGGQEQDDAVQYPVRPAEVREELWTGRSHFREEDGLESAEGQQLQFAGL